MTRPIDDTGAAAYVSPYGYGPITDSVLDCIADRLNIDDSDAIVEAINRAEWDIDAWWTDHMGPAIDALEDAISGFIPEEAL